MDVVRSGAASQVFVRQLTPGGVLPEASA